jgi:hypothetical protein
MGNGLNITIPGAELKATLGNSDGLKGALSSGANLNGQFGGGKIVMNDYRLTVTDIENGKRLEVKRGAEVQTMDIYNGEDGFSPEVEVLGIEGGHRVIITDATGTIYFDVADGLKGDKGDEGDPGETPIVEIAPIDGGHRVFFKYKDGTQYFDVMDGKHGGLQEVPVATANEVGGIKVGQSLTITHDGVLSVDTATDVEEDNTRPITSAAVHSTVGNIEILLATI